MNYRLVRCTSKLPTARCTSVEQRNGQVTSISLGPENHGDLPVYRNLPTSGLASRDMSRKQSKLKAIL